jgi:hypothetical protein
MVRAKEGKEMSTSSFDALAKSVASAPSRRQLLKTLGGGGVLAGLGIAFGRASAPIAVTAQEEPCTISFVGTIRLGPSAGQMLFGSATPGELQGDLAFTPDQDGAIEHGQLQLQDGTMVPVVGQRHGRTINVRLDLGNQQVLVAVGTAEQDLAICQGAVDGLLTGPQHGDLGDWHGTLSRTVTEHHTDTTNNEHHTDDTTDHHPPSHETPTTHHDSPPTDGTMVPTYEPAPPTMVSTMPPIVETAPPGEQSTMAPIYETAPPT